MWTEFDKEKFAGFAKQMEYNGEPSDLHAASSQIFREKSGLDDDDKRHEQ